MLWLCLRLPQLALEALPPPAPGQALVIIEQGRVLLANAPAQDQGIGPGQSSQTAQSLCANLRLENRDPQREQQLMNQIALWAYRFSGSVSLCPPNALLLEVGASLRLFHHLNRLYRHFIAAFRRRQLTIHTAIADTPLAAELLSHRSPPLKNLVTGAGRLRPEGLQRALQTLPVNCLPLTNADIETLQGMGLQQLGQLFELPSHALNRRLGQHLGELLARLQGQRPDPRPRFLPPEDFYSERHFEGGLNNHQQLRFPCAALLGELQHYLRLRQCMSRELCWEFHYLDGGRQPWRLPLNQTHFDKRDVLALVMLALERQQLAAPLETLSLHCQYFIPLQQSSSALLEDHSGRAHSDLPQLLNKLRLRLAPGEYGQYLPLAEHLPELQHYQQSLETLQQNLLSDGGPPSSTGVSKLRPSWLLEPALAIYRQQGDLFWRGSLQLLQGPERLDSHWWQQRQVRDYYLARHQDGRLCWIYRDCLSKGWYLQGFFG